MVSFQNPTWFLNLQLISFFFFNNCILLAVFGCAGSLLYHAGSRYVVVSRGFSMSYTSFSLQLLLFLESTDFRAQAQQLWLMGFVAPWLVGSSQTRDRTGVPCIARQTLNQWTIREAPPPVSLSTTFQVFKSHRD